MDKIFELINKIKDMDNIEGFVDAKPIKASSIITAFWVRFKCKYACGNYNTNLDCPPYSPSPEETAKVLESYEYAILIQCKDDPEVTSKIAITLEKIAIVMEFYKAISFGAGSCKHCQKCNLKSCINRDIARPSMESSGIDVVQTAKNNDYKMVDYDTNSERILYHFSLVLIR
jgi:predicted metal-binding protein